MWTRSSGACSETGAREGIGDRLLRSVVSAFVRRGTLKIVTASGRELAFGDGTAPRVAIRFKDRASQFALAADPHRRLGELYMDGRLIVE